MRAWTRTLAVACALPALAACGDDGTSPDQLTRADIAGRYAVCTLTFTPQGAQPSVDLLTRAFQTTPAPELRVNADGEIQLVYTPAGEGQFATQDIRGVFEVNRRSVTLDFNNTGTRQASTVLLRDPLTLDFIRQPQTLNIAASTPYEVNRTDYARLAGISEAGLAPQIPGSLAATFRASGCT